MWDPESRFVESYTIVFFTEMTKYTCDLTKQQSLKSLFIHLPV